MAAIRIVNPGSIDGSPAKPVARRSVIGDVESGSATRPPEEVDAGATLEDVLANLDAGRTSGAAEGRGAGGAMR
jgi:hypothetical protein